MIDQLRRLTPARNHNINDVEAGKLQTGDEHFMSDVNTAVMLGASPGSHIILAITVLFIVIALFWAANASIDEVTRGEGKVIPSSKIQVIQNLEGGILSEILVTEGEFVEKDQPLLRLDDTRFSSSFSESRLKYLALLAKAARLKAEAGNRELSMPSSVLAERTDLARNEIALYESRQNELQSNLNILGEQEVQINQELAELHARKDKAARSYKLVRQELEMSEPLAADGAISEVEILRLKRAVNDLKGELEASRLAIPRIQSQLEEMKDKIGDLEISFRTKARGELNETEAELSGVEATLKGQQDRVTRTLVRSPVHGAVKQIMVTTIGGVIQPGMDLLEIVPVEGRYCLPATQPGCPGQDHRLRLRNLRGAAR
jgi:adhesin transport system membrane fusion protein